MFKNLYTIPSNFFEDEKYIKLSSSAKLMYSLMLSLNESSIINGLMDENGNCYISVGNMYFTKALGISEPTVIKVKEELSQIGLISEIQIGLQKNNRIYIN